MSLNFHFEQYTSSINKYNFHPKLKITEKVPDDIKELKNIIIYGPDGIGKYSQSLKLIEKYSPSLLKYEKKVTIQSTKDVHYLKISDVHYEVDFFLLGCNSKTLWFEIYQHIVDIVSSKGNKHGIILCKNFHKIHNDLLEIFYSYMQTNFYSSIVIHFIFLTDDLSFIPDSIVNRCDVINIPRPAKSIYSKCKTTCSNECIKSLKGETIDCEKTICNQIVHNIVHYNELNLSKTRSCLYDIFVYNLNVETCIWNILNSLIHSNHIKKENIAELLKYTISFFQYYNNNYRPIYHIELFIYRLISSIHGISI